MANKKHDFTKTEILAGLMVIVSALVLAGFIALIQGWRPKREANIYYMQFTKIIGLNYGADVRFGGVIVGRVTDIVPDPDDQSQIRVEASVGPDVPVNAGSIATVEQTTLTADKHLEISTGEKDADALDSGAYLRTITKSGEFIDIPDLGKVIVGLEDLLGDLIALLGVDEAQQREAAGEEEFPHLTRVAADVRGVLGEATGLVEDLRGVLEEQKPNLETVIANLIEIEKGARKLVNDLGEVLDENRPILTETLVGVQEMVAGVQDIVDDVGAVIDDMTGQLDALLASLQGTLENTEAFSGAANDFFEDNRPTIEDTLLDLRETLRNLKEFSRTMAEQPQAFIRGKSPEGRKE